jgi:hypothetical protein
MPDILDRTVGPVDVPAGDSVLFTGTAGHVYTIKQISIVNGTAGDISIAIGIDGIADADLILPDVFLLAGEWCDFDGILIVSDTETINARASSDGLTFTANALDQSP